MLLILWLFERDDIFGRHRHGFRRSIASNLHELGATDKIGQRIPRHAKPHVTKERYIKAFDRAVLEAMQGMQATLDGL